MKPPRLAEWLLTHTAPGPLTDALAGDLAEEFTRRQSRTWYCRQVLIAIAAHNGVFPFVVLLVTAAAYEFPQPIFRWLFPWRQNSAPFYVSLPWPSSLAVEMAISIATYGIFVAMGLSLSLITARRFRFRAFFVGLLPAIGTLALGEVAMTLSFNLWAPGRHNYRIQYSILTCMALLLAARSARRTPRGGCPRFPLLPRRSRF